MATPIALEVAEDVVRQFFQVTLDHGDRICRLAIAGPLDEQAKSAHVARHRMAVKSNDEVGVGEGPGQQRLVEPEAVAPGGIDSMKT